MRKENLTKSIIILIMAIFISNCSSNEEITNNDSEYLYFFSGKINGESFIYGQKKGETTATYLMSYSNTQPSTCIYSADNGFSYNGGIYPSFDESLPTMDLEFIRLHLCSNNLSQSEIFNDSFPAKEYSYATDDYDTDINAKKIGIYYSPSADSDITFTSYNGNQNNSFFEITNSQNTGTNSLLHQTIEGNFNVVLYNTDNLSDKINITDGKFKIVMQP
jgi:hypothetical protein